MSALRILRPLTQAARACRPALLAPVLPHSARLSSLPLLSARPAPTITLRTFTATARTSERYSPVAGDAKWGKGDPVTYDELKPITQAPNDDILILDVREPNEVALGAIPSSVNLPLSSFEKAIRMDEGDFVREYGFRKPSKTQGIISYCKAGIRAQTAVDLLKAAGFKHVRNYQGSWNDWEKREQSNPNQDD
ncbi:hypothetical protein JCM8097_001489 [Rhodosporidiobolus ruineniae]